MIRGTIAAAAALAATAGQAASLSADLSDHDIRITTGFSGAHVLVFGAIEGGSDVIIAVRGPATKAVLRRKSRVAAVWLNVDSYRYEAIPGYYATLANRPIETILGAEERGNAEIGTDSLKLDAAAQQDQSSSAEFRQALIEDLEHQGLYTQHPHAVGFDADVRLFQARLDLPPTVPTGAYTVTVFLVEAGRVVDLKRLDLGIEEAGAAAELDSLANHRPRLYGLLAVLVSAMAGLLGRSLFRQR